MKNLMMTLMIGGSMIAFSAGVQAQNTMGMDNNARNFENNNFVTLEGQIESIMDDEFVLNYGGQKNITVELDNFGFNGEETKYLTVGDNVTVKGFVDDDLFEGREVEATQVELSDQYITYFYAPMSGQSGMTNNQKTSTNNNSMSSGAQAYEDGAYVRVTGTVQGITDDEMQVKTDNRTLTVSLNELDYDVTGDNNQQALNIEQGDRVYVYGEMNDEFFDSRELVADGVVELSSANNMQNNNRRMNTSMNNTNM